MRHSACRVTAKNKNAALEKPARRDCGGRLLAPRRHLQFCADMGGDLGWIVIDEMSDPVMGNAPEFGPIPQGAYRRLLARGEDPAQAKADNIRELTSNGS